MIFFETLAIGYVVSLVTFIVVYVTTKVHIWQTSGFRFTQNQFSRVYKIIAEQSAIDIQQNTS